MTIALIVGSLDGTDPLMRCSTEKGEREQGSATNRDKRRRRAEENRVRFDALRNCDEPARVEAGWLVGCETGTGRGARVVLAM